MVNHLFFQIVPFMKQCGKKGTAAQATCDNIIWRRKDVICMPEN